MYIDAVHRCQNWRRLVIICHGPSPSPSTGSTLGHCIAVDFLLCAETTSETDPFITGDSRPLSHALTFAAKSSLFCWFNSFCFPGFYGVMFEEILRDVFLYLGAIHK